MEEKQTMTQAQLAAALSRRRGSITLFKILTYGSGLAAVLLLAAGLVPVALICLVLAFVFGYRLSKNTAALKTLLSGNIVSGWDGCSVKLQQKQKGWNGLYVELDRESNRTVSDPAWNDAGKCRTPVYWQTDG